MAKKYRVLSLFSGCGGMDIGFEGGFLIPKATLNTNIHKDWIERESNNQFLLKSTMFETHFANDIMEHAKSAWVDYFSKKRNVDVNSIYHVESIVDIVKKYRKRGKKYEAD